MYSTTDEINFESKISSGKFTSVDSTFIFNSYLCSVEIIGRGPLVVGLLVKVQ